MSERNCLIAVIFNGPRHITGDSGFGRRKSIETTLIPKGPTTGKMPGGPD